MHLSHFEKNLAAAQNLKQLNQVLEKYLHDLNIKTFAFTYYSYHPNSLNKLKFDFVAANFKAWHEHYIGEGYEEIDSTLEAVYNTSLPTFWELKQQLEEAQTSREKQMRIDSINFGIECGLSIPIHGPKEDFAILLVAQKRGETCLMQWQTLRYELFTVAYCYYTYLQKHLLKEQVPVKKYQLNKRQVQCLALLAQQCSVKSIATQLNITERTVNYHIQRLNKKLGTHNKYQSVIKALRENLIAF